MVESFVKTTLATSWCCSGLPAPPRVCTLAAGIPDDCLEGGPDGKEEPAWFDKSRHATHGHLPPLASKTLAMEIESLSKRLQRCEKSIDRVFGADAKDGYPSAIAAIDARTPLCRLIEDLQLGQSNLQKQFGKDRDVIKGIEDRSKSLQRKLEANCTAQTEIEERLSQLSSQVTDMAAGHDPLEMGPVLGKSLNTCEWGALFAESKKEIEECRHRIDELAQGYSGNHRRQAGSGEAHSPPFSPHPASVTSVPLAWDVLQHSRPDSPATQSVRRQESERQLHMMQQASASSPLSSGSSPISNSQDKWRPLPVMRPPASRKSTS